MRFVITAANEIVRSGLSRPSATEAFDAVAELQAASFDIIDIMDEEGASVSIPVLGKLAALEVEGKG